MLREICGREYERIMNTLFMNLSHVMRTYYRREKFVWVLHRSEGIVRICHICDKSARSFHRCDKYIRIFHACDRFFYFHIRTNLSHLWKNSHVSVTNVKTSNEFFTGMTNTCESFTRLKLDICEKLVPIKIWKLVVRKFHTYQNMMYSCE